MQYCARFLKCPTTIGKLCDKKFRNFIAWYQKKIVYVFDFNQMVFKLFKKSGVEVTVSVSLSVTLFQRRGPHEDIANFLALKYI